MWLSDMQSSLPNVWYPLTAIDLNVGHFFFQPPPACTPERASAFKTIVIGSVSQHSQKGVLQLEFG